MDGRCTEFGCKRKTAILRRDVKSHEWRHRPRTGGNTLRTASSPSLASWCRRRTETDQTLSRHSGQLASRMQKMTDINAARETHPYYGSGSAGLPRPGKARKNCSRSDKAIDDSARFVARLFSRRCWGGINLEDIASPECFIIEQKLKEVMNNPVFHDDQHGTAIITLAGLINAAHGT